MQFSMVYDFNMNIADSKEAKMIDKNISSKYKISPLIRMEIAGLRSVSYTHLTLPTKRIV